MLALLYHMTDHYDFAHEPQMIAQIATITRLLRRGEELR